MLLKYKKLLALFIVLSLIYIVQTVILSPDPRALAKYHLTSGQASFLGLTVAIPYILIWFIALTGYVRFRAYATAIRRSKEGPAFHWISHGLFGLTIWLPFSAIVGNLASHIYNTHPSAAAGTVRFKNYIILLLLLVTFTALYEGAKRLGALVKPSPYSTWQSLWFTFFVTLISLYAVFSLHDPARHSPTAAVPIASYYLPDWLIVSTILLPRVIMWTLGFLAVQYIYVYWKASKGVIYKNSLQYVGAGLGFVIVSSMLLHYLQSLPTQLNNLTLGPILLLLYGLLVWLSVGYVLIARGARKLQLIEEL